MSDDERINSNSYLSFRLGKEVFAAHVAKVVNILEMTKITKIPRSKQHMKGVINLRGSVLPVVDTRIKFGLSETTVTMNTCIIVMELINDGAALKVGAMVDSVQEVFEIDPAHILPPPSIGNKYKSEYIEGIGKIGDDFVMILDIDKVFSVDDVFGIDNDTVNPKVGRKVG